MSTYELKKTEGHLPIYFRRIPKLLAFVSSIMKLEAGDIVLTGTPKGVGPIKAGDIVTAGLRSGNLDSDILQVKYNVADRNGHFKA